MSDTAQNKLQQQLALYLEGLKEPPKTFERGQIIKGIIVSITKGEVLVDVGGRAEGVVSGKEMKLEGEKFDKKVGDEILVYVIKGENDLGQIELSIRRTGTARKWFDLQKAQESDASLSVQVIEANTGGVIVNIGGGLRGFIPTSQLDNARIYPLGGYTSKEEAGKELQSKLAELIGTDIEVKVIEIDREKNRVIFSEKQVTSDLDPEKREKTLEAVNVGDTLSGEVTGIAPFGLFVSADGLEGLVHLSEISWDKVTNPADFHKVGDKVKVQLIGVDDGGKRIAYSIKRLQKDPWEEIITKYKVGQRVKGEITKIVDYGAFVRIEDGLNGLIHISELSDKLVKDPSKIVEIGQTYDLEIISMSREERHLGLSLKRTKDEAPVKEKDADEPVKKDTVEKVSPEMARLSEYLDEDGETEADKK
ncbi:MAG: S1 RNA-binding domain-containing protein [Candidatus Dojkabacteria bacterium]|uniref:S1 RNA-binding domain-containing protein n=2 Tax=Candidatus Dojkabacteria TaxID=74243 RepID=A0A952DVB7_9BACT|nr:S1 RNA-binding domain-containing protein [Candidatus Dojkabacteria bacterium]WKZ28436.1 MAG: S1 RNA-binding domain-containing protein [Candidatus Dojkabacteria bacterium]